MSSTPSLYSFLCLFVSPFFGTPRHDSIAFSPSPSVHVNFYNVFDLSVSLRSNLYPPLPLFIPFLPGVQEQTCVRPPSQCIVCSSPEVLPTSFLDSLYNLHLPLPSPFVNTYPLRGPDPLYAPSPVRYPVPTVECEPFTDRSLLLGLTRVLLWVCTSYLSPPPPDLLRFLPVFSTPILSFWLSPRGRRPLVHSAHIAPRESQGPNVHQSYRRGAFVGNLGGRGRI